MICPRVFRSYREFPNSSFRHLSWLIDNAQLLGLSIAYDLVNALLLALFPSVFASRASPSCRPL